MERIPKQIIRHDFTKEFKRLEYEVKFEIKDKRLDALGCLKTIEKCFANKSSFILCKVKGGDKLVTRSTFLQKGGVEYSFFKYRGARMLKVKKHNVVKARPLSFFVNSERLLIDREDFSKKLRHLRHRFRRHSYSLINLEAYLNNLVPNSEYMGEMIKTRVKDFVLDSHDGRIYAIAVTFCKSKNRIQKQFEVEYSGYLLGYSRFNKNSQRQVMSGLLGLSNHIYRCLPKMLKPSVERKFEFVKKAYGK